MLKVLGRPGATGGPHPEAARMSRDNVRRELEELLRG